MLSLAFGCAQFGLALAVSFLVIAACLTLLSLNVLALLALDFKKLYPGQRPTFYSISSSIFPRFSWVLDFSSLVFCSGAVIAYLNNVGKMLALSLWNIVRWDRATFSQEKAALVIQAGIVLLLAPLCLMKNLGSAKYLSIAGLLCIIYIVIMTLFYVPCTAARANMQPLLNPAGVLEVFVTFPLFIFAFICQMSVFTVVNELKDPSPARLNKVFFSAVGTCSVIYLLCMVLPFLTFGPGVQSNYLASLVGSDGSIDGAVTVSYIATAASLSISFVLLMLPIRVSFMMLVLGNKLLEDSLVTRWRVSTIVCTLLISFGTSALLGENLTLPIEIAGLLGGNTFGFVFPFALYLKHYGLKTDKRIMSYSVLLSLVFCCLLYPVSLAGILNPENLAH
jgi:amino acid permease